MGFFRDFFDFIVGIINGIKWFVRGIWTILKGLFELIVFFFDHIE